MTVAPSRAAFDESCLHRRSRLHRSSDGSAALSGCARNVPLVLRRYIRSDCSESRDAVRAMGSPRSRSGEGTVNRKMATMPRSREVIDDRFMIEQLAGFGGFGQIYRARDLRTHTLVALKIMHDAERLELERFAREAQVLATLSHPGIVRYIDHGITADGDPYLVMEWLSGETLSTRLQRTQLTIAEALALGRRVASALSAIHRGGIVHRDIKPSNLFLRDGAIDKVTLIDFGMARRPLADPRLTVTGTMLGTPGYIAPEQVDHFSTLDGRADIFSLGCVLYRCISGRAPFRGPDA